MIYCCVLTVYNALYKFSATLMFEFCSAAGSRDNNVSLSFSAYVSRSTSLLATHTASLFSVYQEYACLSPIHHHESRPEFDVFHFISIRLSLPALSSWY